MRNTHKTILLMALLAGAFAASSIKNKLAQKNANNLAQAESETEGAGWGWNDCDPC